VLNAALRDDKLSTLPLIHEQVNPIEWLQENLKVSSQAEIMTVSLTASDAKSAKAIVDAVVDAYLQEVVIAEESERRNRLDNLERVYTEAENKLRGKRAELRTLADSLVTSDSESLNLAQQGAIQQWGFARSALTNLQFDL